MSAHPHGSTLSTLCWWLAGLTGSVIAALWNFVWQLQVRMEQGLRTAERQPPGGTIIALAIVTGLLLLVRLWLDRHLELMFDEAYYALWSKHLAWCYLDHPPMVALSIRLSTWLFGDHEFGIRALGTLAAAAGGPLVYLVSLRLFENRTEAAFAGLLYCSMLLIAAGAIIITPDTPLLFFWSIAVYAVVRIYRDADWRWWMVAGAAMGLALQSKYTALAARCGHRLFDGFRSGNAALVATSGAVRRWCGGLRDLRPGHRVELRARLGFVRQAVRSYAMARRQPAVRR